jgi:LytS/YehU family sensor histidine kinase
LYGLSILQPGKIPDLLLKLSDILRYSIYDTKQAFVPLADELAYIQNYIQLEKIRIGDRLSLSTDIIGVENTTSRIAPMLLITFIENAFKHSKNTFDQNIKIKISLHIVDSTILFNIENTCGDDKNEKDNIDKSSGLGLPNTIKRLKLLYPEEHELDCYKQNNYYYVKLKLKTK